MSKRFASLPPLLLALALLWAIPAAAQPLSRPPGDPAATTYPAKGSPAVDSGRATGMRAMMLLVIALVLVALRRTVRPGRRHRFSTGDPGPCAPARPPARSTPPPNHGFRELITRLQAR